jgi:hypothetical protein
MRMNRLEPHSRLPSIYSLVVTAPSSIIVRSRRWQGDVVWLGSDCWELMRWTRIRPPTGCYMWNSFHVLALGPHRGDLWHMDACEIVVFHTLRPPSVQ